MNGMIEALLGLDTMTDQVIALDLLNSAKSGIKLYAVACTESSTPEAKAILIKHLHEAIDTHARVTEYMMERGWYRPYALNEQIQLDMKNAETAAGLPG